MINRDDGGYTDKVGCYAEGAREFEGGGSIESSCRTIVRNMNTHEHEKDEEDLLVPGRDEATCCKSLTDAHAFLFTPTYTPNSCVAHQGVCTVFQSKDSCIEIRDEPCKLFPALAFNPRSRRASLCGKMDGFVDGEGGEKDVVLWTVLDVTTVVTLDFGRGEGVIVDVSGYGMIF